MEELSELSSIQCVKVSLLIGVVCGATALGVISLRWAAIDVKTKKTRNMMQAEAFLRKVLETCVNRPLILVDKGPWYPEALRTLGLKWRHVTFGMRNRIERWFGILKARTKPSTTTSRITQQSRA